MSQLSRLMGLGSEGGGASGVVHTSVDSSQAPHTGSPPQDCTYSCTRVQLYCTYCFFFTAILNVPLGTRRLHHYSCNAQLFLQNKGLGGPPRTVTFFW